MFFRAGFMLAAFWLMTARGSEMARRIVASLSFQWPCLVTEVVLDLVTEFWSWTFGQGVVGPGPSSPVFGPGLRLWRTRRLWS